MLPCRTEEACKKPQMPALLNLLNLLLSGIHANKEDDLCHCEATQSSWKCQLGEFLKPE